MIIFAISNLFRTGFAGAGNWSSGSVPAFYWIPVVGEAAAVETGKGSQADLHHNKRDRAPAARWRWRRSRTYVVGRQHEAVVDVPGADDVLVDLVGYEDPNRAAPVNHPVRCHLDRAGGQYSFAADQVPPSPAARRKSPYIKLTDQRSKLARPSASKR